jgi:hypothetical protein
MIEAVLILPTAPPERSFCREKEPITAKKQRS